MSAVSIGAFEKGGDMRESNLRLLTLTSEAAGIIFQASCSERASFIKSL